MSKHAEDRRRAAEEIELGSRVTDYAGWVDKDRNDVPEGSPHPTQGDSED